MQATDQQLRQFSPQEYLAVYQAPDFVKRPAEAVSGRRRVPAMYRPNVVKTVSLLRLAPVASGRIELARAGVWHMHAIPARARSSAIGHLFQIATSELPQIPLESGGLGYFVRPRAIVLPKPQNLHGHYTATEALALGLRGTRA